MTLKTAEIRTKSEPRNASVFIGQQALAYEVGLVIRPSLPEGYSFDGMETISTTEILDLFRAVEIGEDLDDDYLVGRNDSIKSIGAKVIDIGVRDNDSQLVGFASIVYQDRSGEFTDFVVSPKAQGKGLGRALVDARLAIAEAANIDSLFIADLEPTNNLRTYYIEKGFQEDATGDMTRGPKPISFSGLATTLRN